MFVCECACAGVCIWVIGCVYVFVCVRVLGVCGCVCVCGCVGVCVGVCVYVCVCATINRSEGRPLGPVVIRPYRLNRIDPHLQAKYASSASPG